MLCCSAQPAPKEVNGGAAATDAPTQIEVPAAVKRDVKPGCEFIARAKVALEAAKTASKTVDDGKEIPMEIAIVDHNANLVVFEQMPDAWLGSIDIAVRKARTARFFDMPTEAIGSLSQPGGPLFEIEESNGGLISFPGGQVLKSGSNVVGAIGVSGGSVEQDKIVALAGKAAFEAEESEVPVGLKYEESMVVLEAALRKCASTKSDVYSGSVKMNVAVVDSGGNLLQFARQDGAWLGSADIAIKKAKTAAYFARALGTTSLTEAVKPGADLYGIGGSNGGLITFPGGLAIARNGICLGAIGVSGDSVAADAAVAKAGVEAFAKGIIWTGPPSDFTFANAGQTFDIPLSQALAAIHAGRKYVMSTEGVNPMNIAITDPGGNLIAFTRMTQAWLGSADIAVKKACTSISFNMDTGIIGQLSDPSKPGNSLYGIELSNGGLISFPGGVPVMSKWDLVCGGIGVSGGSVEHDHQVATETNKAFAGWKAADATFQHPEPLVLEAALAVIEKAKTVAARIGKKFDYCVVDRFLNVVALHRQEGAWRGSIDIACKKAKTAMMFNMNTEAIGGLSQPSTTGDVASASLYRIEHSNNFLFPGNILAANAGHWGANEAGGLITFGGGVPIQGKNGLPIGGFGVSGSSVDDDKLVALAGLTALH